MLTGLAKHLFGEVEMRWREDFFPFTVPSFELDVFFNDDWMEVGPLPANGIASHGIMYGILL